MSVLIHAQIPMPVYVHVDSRLTLSLAGGAHRASRLSTPRRLAQVL